jgi:hypothetical protein
MAFPPLVVFLVHFHSVCRSRIAPAMLDWRLPVSAPVRAAKLAETQKLEPDLLAARQAVACALHDISFQKAREALKDAP